VKTKQLKYRSQPCSHATLRVYLAAGEKNQDFSHQLRDKIWE